MDAILRNNFIEESGDSLVGYKLVADVRVDANTSRVDITDITINKDEDYLIISDISNTTSTYGEARLFVNDNITASSYQCQYVSPQSTNIAGGRISSPFFNGCRPSKKSFAITKVKISNDGKLVYQSRINRSYGNGASGTLDSLMVYGSSSFTVENINKISIGTDVANSIGLGSSFKIYKRVSEVVADITVDSATTDITINGLNISKGNQYMIVGTLIGSGSAFLYVNSDTNSSSYYCQQYNINGSSSSSSRQNAPYISDFSTGSMLYANMYITNDYYFVSDSYTALRYGTTAINMTDRVLATVNTVEVVESITIASSVSNGISAGTRLQVIKFV